MKCAISRDGSGKTPASRAVVLFVGGVLALSASGCQGPESAQGAVVDDEIDDEILAGLEGSADGADPCADHPGGPLTGDDLLVIISKEEGRQLQAGWEAPDLFAVSAAYMMPGRNGVARHAALEAFYELAEAARVEAGLDLGLRSAYRSFTRQCFTFNYKVSVSGEEHADRYSARPGRSEHQLGTALDITSSRLGWQVEDFIGEEPEGIWLADNAHRFGFGLSYPEGYEEQTGYGYEPWHWRYIGRDAAAEMARERLMLFEYLRRCDEEDPDLECPREAPPVIEPNAGFIGGACEHFEECSSLGGEASCLGFPYVDGYCTIPCERYCPDRPGLNATTFCVEDMPGSSTGLCHSQCDTALYPDGGCRAGYSCQEASRPLNGGNGSVCLPAQ